MTTATAAGLTPDLFGYIQCIRCGTWRRPEGIEAMHCIELDWCSKAAGRVATLKTGIDPNGDAV